MKKMDLKLITEITEEAELEKEQFANNNNNIN